MQPSETSLLDFLRSNPHSVETLEQLASLYSEETRYTEALDTYERLIELQPSNPEYYNDVGVLLYSIGVDDEAEWMLKKSLELGGGFVDAHINLARVLSQQGKTPDAIKQYWHYFQKRPEDGVTWEEFRALLKARNLNRVLIVMEEGIGNMVMLTPTIRAMKSVYPEVGIDVLGKYPALEIVENWDLVTRALTQPDKTRYAAVLYSMWSSEAKRLHGDLLARHGAHQFEISYDSAMEHEALNHLRMAKALGFRKQLPEPFCPVEEIDVDIEQEQRVIGICDTSLPLPDWEKKRWPHYQGLAKLLASKGYQIALFGGMTEGSRFTPQDWSPGTLNFMEKYTLPQTAYLMTKCEAVVANDSGLAHMAAALGIRTVVLFGPTLTTKNLPLGRNVKPVYLDLGCRPCQYTDRWDKCKNWLCMKEMTVEKVLPLVVENGHRQGHNIKIGSNAISELKIIGKDCLGCQLVKEDNLTYLVKDGVKERFRVHLVGAKKANFPWGMENEIFKALELEGIEVLDTDYRLDREDFAELFLREAHVMLVCKGSGIPPELVRRYRGRTILWYQDDIFTTAHAPRDLAFNGKAFDIVYSFDKSALDEYRQYGIEDVKWLPLAMSPAVHRKMYLPKMHNVAFVGNMHPNRKAFLERLQRRFNVLIKRAFMDEMVQIFNQSKIVLNLGIGPTGIQQRVFEALGCGSFLITNEIPSDGRLFEDRKHLVYFNEQNIESLIAYFLEHEEERERIAYQGYIEAHAKHTFQRRICQLLKETLTPVEELTSISIDTTKKPEEINRKSKRRLLLFWHGIGDNIMATPALRAFREAHPDDFIGYMYLKRIQKDGLMNGCPYIDDIHTCSDAWDDYPDYDTGVKAVIEEARQLAIREGYDEVIPLTLRGMPLTHHRIERIACELGVPLSNWSTEMWISKGERRAAEKILSKWGIGSSDFIVAIHRRGANIHKYWEVDETQKVVDYLRVHYDAKVIAFETHTDLNREPAKQVKGVFSTADLGELPLKVSAALIERCNLYIGLDSGPMWLATTTNTPLVALFTMTWMHESAPLRSNSVVVASDQSWQMAHDAFKQAYQDRIVHDSAGGTRIRAESVLKAIGKLDLRLNEQTPQANLHRQTTTPIKRTLDYTPPAGFHQPGAYWGAFVTLSCSANCDFCIQKIVPDEFEKAKRRYKDMLSAEDWVSFLNGIGHQSGQPLALIGGEPSLHPGFIDILNNLEGYAITVTTNLISKHFGDIDSFVKKLHSKCPVRFNTSFHPGFIEPEEYVNRVRKMRAHGLWVDQVAMVDNPGGDYKKYAEIFQKLGITLRPQSFLGIHNGRLYPNEQDPSVTNDPREHGITDYTLYREGFSARSRKPAMCQTRRFLMAPDGSVHNCHYHLYSGRGSIGHLARGDVFLRDDVYFCPDFGYCNPCDYPHVKFKPLMQDPKPKNCIVMPKRESKSYKETDNQTCPICSQKLEGPEVKDMMFCPSCRIYKKKEILLPGILKENLKTFAIGALASPNKGEQRLRKAEKQLNWILQSVPGTGRFFDVGASGGFMMKIAQDLGWEVKGNEISITSIQWAKSQFGLDITYGLLEELPIEEEAYDLVVFWHSLEHSQNLEKTMETVQKMVKPAGHVAVAVPLKENDQELKRHYESLHFYEFSEPALRKLMKKYGFGHVDSRVLAGSSNKRQVQAVFRKRSHVINDLSVPVVTGRVSGGRMLVTGPGHSGTNWTTEIIRATGKYKFTEAVEDRAFFLHPEIPEQYATKLATDNVGMYWHNLKQRMDQYQDMFVVYTIRHPVDNAMSKLMRAMPMEGHEPIKFLWELSWDGTLNGTVKSLEHAHQIYLNLKSEYPDRFLSVRLEDLILKSEKTTKSICEFIGVPYDRSYAEAYKNIRNKWQQLRYQGKKDQSQIDMYKRADDVHQGFFKDKKHLVDFMKEHLRPISMELGYTVEP